MSRRDFLSALPGQTPYRRRDWRAYRDRMLALTARVTFDQGPGQGPPPLAALTTRDPTDPTIALIEAWAVAADIANFYGERILNEGNPRTALEDGSLDLLGRGLGYAPEQYVAAQGAVGLFVDPGVSDGAVLPASTLIPGPSTSDGAPLAYETASRVTAWADLNAIRPLRTLARRLDGEDRSLEIEGLGLGLQPGDPVLLSDASVDPPLWLRVDLVDVTEVPTRSTTVLRLADTLAQLWARAGHDAPWPFGPERIPPYPDIHALRVATNLFGHDAQPWSTAGPQEQQAATPPGYRPGDFDEWPGFGVDLGRLDLSEIDAGIVPGSLLLVDKPAEALFGQVQQASVVACDAFGQAAQVTRLVPRSLVARKTRAALRPGRYDHTLTRLRDGRVLIIGGRGPDGALADTRLYDPETGVISDGPALPGPRAGHTISLLADQSLVVIGGDDGDRVLGSILRLALDQGAIGDFETLDASLITPRTGHRATVLPDGQVLVSGGLDQPVGAPDATPLAALERFQPYDGVCRPSPAMSVGRHGHSATLCYNPDLAPLVVLAGGEGPAAATYEVYWPTLDTISSDSALPTPCGFHLAAPTTKAGVVLIGGRAADGATAAIQVFDPAWGWSPSLVRLANARYDAQIVEQADGRYLIMGGLDDRGFLDSVEVYDSDRDAIEPRRPMTRPCAPGALKLSDSRICILGGRDEAGPIDQALFYDNRIGAFDAVARLGREADGLAGARLSTGQWFISGGHRPSPPPPAPYADPYMDQCSLFDPRTGSCVAAGDMVLPRTGHTATALNTGAVLLAGGKAPSTYAELWDPASRACSPTGALGAGRYRHTATLLDDGRVLVAGGFDTASPFVTLASCEIYDPAMGAFTDTRAPLSVSIAKHAAVALPGGLAMLIGGLTGAGTSANPTPAVVIYDPTIDQFIEDQTQLNTARADHTATVLGDGRVLVTGGSGAGGVLNTAELYFPSSRGFRPLPNPMTAARTDHTATLLPDGRVLLVGGRDADDTPLRTAELFDPRTDSFSPVTAETLEPRGAAIAAFFPGLGVALVGGPSDLIEAYVTEPASEPSLRRKIRILTQSQALTLAAPLDPSPITGAAITLDSLSPHLSTGQAAAVVGPPPQAVVEADLRLVDPVSGRIQTLARNTRVDALERSVDPIGGVAPGVYRWRLRAPLGFEGECFAPLAALRFTIDETALDPSPIPSALPPGAQAERVTLAAVALGAGGQTVAVTLEPALTKLYDRHQVAVWGNLVQVRQGETVDEVLGDGDPGLAFQTFGLSRAPLALVDTEEGQGPAPEITVRVNGAPWRRVASLEASGPSDQVYSVDMDTRGAARVLFGDGAHGARPPSGPDNITVAYRVGGGETGNLAAGALDSAPAPLAGLLNPLPLTGGVGAATASERRWRAPFSARGLDRIVSVEDFAVFALQQPGIGKARAVLLRPPVGAAGEPVVVLSLAARDGAAIPPASPRLQRLRERIAAAARPGLVFELADAEIVRFDLGVEILVIEGWDAAAIAAQARAMIQGDYDLGRRSFEEPVRASDIVARLQAIPGVAGVTPRALHRTGAPAILAPYLAARPAEWTPLGVTRAEILILGQTAISTGSAP